MVAMSIHLLATIFGVLGNIVSFGVFISPMPTFWSIIKKKSTQGFQSLPYSVALFSCMLYLYYAMIKENNGTLIITINTVGVVVESFYLTVYMIYANKKAKVYTTKLIFFFNVVFFSCIVVGTLFFARGSKSHRLFSQGGIRESVVGWICAVFSLCVFAAPLSVMRLVIKTKSVEFMPFCLSFSLTLCAVMWFFYGFLIHDLYIAMPNVLGFLFGITQMILYAIYKDSKKKPTIEINEADIKQLQELAADIKLGKIEMINEEHIINFEQNRPEVIEVILDDNNNENVAVNGQVVAEKENEKKGENQAFDDGEPNNNNNDVKGNGEKLAVVELPRGESSV